MNDIEERLDVLMRTIEEKETHLEMLEEKVALLDSVMSFLEEIAASLGDVEVIDENLENF